MNRERGLRRARAGVWAIALVVLCCAVQPVACGGEPGVSTDRGRTVAPAVGGAVSVAPVAQALTLPVSTNTSNFNGTAIAAGRHLWFTSVMKVTGVGSTPVRLYFSQGHITFSASGVAYDLPVPDARVTIDPGATLATTTFQTDLARWDTVLPAGYSGNGFLTALTQPVSTALPGGISPVTWSGIFQSDTPGITVQWQWAAAVYSSFSTDYNALLVKPVDGPQLSVYPNSDHAGTPEAYKSNVVGGARGGGGSNYTGSLSGTVTVSPAACSETASTDPTCDGIDDNCNAVADEDYVSQPTSCGTGACQRSGSTLCSDGAVLDSCVPGAPGPDDLACDGVDSDCDGSTDEGFNPTPTSCGIGACAAAGSLQCVAGAVQDTCAPGVPASQDATCNAVDDDCNGLSDEDYVELATSCGTDPCARTGSTQCEDGAESDTCVVLCEGACADLLDDDGDGLIDCDDDDCDQSLECVAVGQPCTLDSECGALGPGAMCLQQIAGGQCSLPCQGDPSACPFGSICGGTFCGLPCDEQGACSDEAHECSEALGPSAPVCHPICPYTACLEDYYCDAPSGLCLQCAETDPDCDGVDVDCDGLTDDDYAPQATSCGVGACAASGMTACVAGAVQDSCTPGTPAASDATCNGIDDDCSGAADEDYVSQATTCGIGGCASTGSTSCVAGSVQDSCVPSTALPSDALCDGVDGDCDGETDEDYVSQSTTCGIGACAASGSTSCVSGSVQDSCPPGTPAANDATCNGIDDDCNGTADEDFTGVATSCGIGACSRTGSTLCVNATIVAGCTPGTPAPSDGSCDSIDDDCDGHADEDYQSVPTTCGFGGCIASGMSSCVDGTFHTNCVPPDPQTTLDPTCDGSDDDCNGRIDEDVPSTCSGTARVTCINGAFHTIECLDSNVCDGQEYCLDGICLTAPAIIDDGNRCTLDGCDPALGVTHESVPFGTSCADANVCNGEEFCVFGGGGQCPALPVGAVSWWPGEGNTADILGGLSGVALGGPSFSPAHVDQGLSFDGVDDRVDLSAHAQVLNLAGTASLELWLEVPIDACRTLFHLRQDDAHQQLLQVGNGCTSELSDELVTWRYLNDGVISVVAHATSTRSRLIDSGFHHLAVTFDGSATRIYIDGVVRAVSIGLGTDHGDFGGFADPISATLGATQAASAASFFEGVADEVTLYDRPLTAAEVSAIFERGQSGKCKGTTCAPGTPLVMDDGNPCTADACDPTQGATHAPLTGGACDDGNQCTGEGHCQAGSCQPGAPVSVVSDNNPCTEDRCDEVAGLYPPTPAGTPCDDGNLCTANDECNGARICIPGDPVPPGQPSATDATCDGIDDDCDGSDDDDYASTPTGCGVGACARTGTRTCVNGQPSDSCVPGSAAPSDASCNGVDDDCSGLSDEDYVSQMTTCGAGACASMGSTSCVAGAVQDSCQPSTAMASDEICDGIDEDCDGTIDEDYVSQMTTCGAGACASMGSTSCVAGVVHDSCAPPASDPSCDGVDDDCDGEVDEDFVSQPTSCGTGACARSGATVCLQGDVLDDCTPGTPSPSDVSCDGIDDDCDGLSDDGFVSQPTSCGTGACARTGSTSCTGGAIHDSCAPAQAAPSDASCDGIDQDCNGASDEDFVSQASACGVGACGATGATSCVEAVVYDNCTPGSPASTDPTCDGFDDDCSGQVDEDYATQSSSCGMGACAATGVVTCVNGAVQDSCQPGTAAPSDVSCDGIDQDCNGQNDEDFQPTCSGSSRLACTNGSVQLIACTDADACNGLESCAAGACLPGTPPQVDDGNLCTLDSCNPLTGAITHLPLPIGESCSDGETCNGAEICEETEETCVSPPGTKAWWRGEGNADDSQDSMHGTLLNGVGFAPGKVDQAFVLDGINDAVKLSDHAVALNNLGGKATLEFWLKSTFDICRTLFHLRQSGSAEQFLQIGNGCSGVLTNEILTWSYINAGVASQVAHTTTNRAVLLDSKWHHVAITFDGTTTQIYIDGAAVVTSIAVGTNHGDWGGFAAPTNAAIGSTLSTGTPALVFFGSLDEVTLYDRPLSSLEIATIFTEGKCTGPNIACHSGIPEPAGSSCDDGERCTVGDACDGAGACTPGTALPPGTTPTDPTCDGFDDDCDRTNDDEYPAQATSCGVGACAATGMLTCANGVEVDSCQPGVAAASDASCNGVDEDCNGASDEDYASVLTSCGLGTCAATGSTSCAGGVVQDTCTPGTPAASDASCNGVDEDCSGAADDDYVSQPTSCGVGACAATGIRTCTGGMVADSCAPSAPGPDDSVCNGVDDDCDGSSDEDHQLRCAGTALVHCVAGAEQPTPCDDGNTCNGAESCANAACVPGTPPPLDDQNACTSDSCAPATGVVHTLLPEGASCSDGQPCNGAEQCLSFGPVERFIQLNPRRTYFTALPGDDNVLDARAHSLAALGVQPGDRLRLRRVGSFIGGNQDLTGVFSSSDVLLSASTAHRVPGAIASDRPPFETTTDIAQDFHFGVQGVIVTVPAGATHFFASTFTAQKGDNSDPDGDFGFMAAKDVPAGFGCRPTPPPNLDDGNACTSDSCDPELGVVHDPYPQGAQSCADLGAECGQHDDGCGVMIDCGSCPQGQACGTLTAGECGPPALQVTPRIHVSREVNVALFENGGRVVLPDGTLVHGSFIDAGGANVSTGTFPGRKAFTVRLAGATAPVVDRLRFNWEHATGGGANRFELWVSADETFDAEAFTRIVDMAMPSVSGPVEVSFPDQRVRFMRLVFDNTLFSGAWAGNLGALRVFTRAREGGVVSLIEGGADVIAASSEPRPGGNALVATSPFDLLERGFDPNWMTASSSNEWVTVELSPAGYGISQLELISTSTSDSLKDFELQVSTTGSAQADFTTVLAATSSNTGGLYTFEFDPAAARYARLNLQNSYGANAISMRRIRLFSQELGGATVPFDDYTALPASEVAARLWEFGDGTTSTEAHPRHTYAAPGTYAVTLTVTDVEGRVGVAHASYTVLQTAVADFDWSPKPLFETGPTGGVRTPFIDLSQPAPGQRVLQRTWSSIFTRLYGCGPAGCGEAIEQTTTFEPVQQIRYIQDGIYPLQLTVLDSQLLTASVVKQVEVLNRAPRVNAGPDVSTIWGEVVAVGTGFGQVEDDGHLDRDTLRCEWSFGDGQTRVFQPCTGQTFLQIPHVYADPGTYQAVLTAFDDDTSTADPITVTVDRRPTLLVPLTMTPTAVDGDFELSARLFDWLDHQAPMVGFQVEFIHDGQVVTATTGADSIARAIVHFEPLSYSTVQYAFAGDARYHGSEDTVDFIVQEGDSEPQQANANAQPSAHEGVRFVVAFPQNADFAHYGHKRLQVMLSSRVATTARVRAPAVGFDVTVAVEPGRLTPVTVPDALRMGLGTGDVIVGDSGILENKGIEVTSLDEIAVHAVDLIPSGTDAFLALPVERLGTDHLVLAIYNEKWTRFFGRTEGSQVAIAAVEDDTLVTIIPNAEVPAGPDLPGGAARGESFTIALDALQTFQIHAKHTGPDFEDLSGTRVLSNKPIAVYGGHACTPLSSTHSACDHMVEQMPPMSSFGTHFVTAPLLDRDGDILRVLAGYDATEVRVDGMLVATLDRGEVHQLRTSGAGYHEIVTSQPSLVGQYARGATFLEVWDPDFMLVPATDKFVDRIVLEPPPLLRLTPPDAWPPVYWGFTNFIHVMAKSSEVGSVRMDGQAVPVAWRPIGDGTYAAARMPVGYDPHVFENLAPDGKLMAYGYGRAGYDSYMMLGGMQLAQPQCRPTQTVPGDGLDNDCDGIEAEELDNDVDDDGDGVEDEDLALQVDPNAPNRRPLMFGGSYPFRRGVETVALAGYDPDGDALSYRIVSAPHPVFGQATVSGHLVSFPSAAGESFDILVAASDGELESEPAAITFATGDYGCEDPLHSTINRCNERPYFIGGSFFTQVIKVPPGQVLAWSARALAQDWDRHAVTYSLQGEPSGMSIDPITGIVNWVVDSLMAGTYTMTVFATDAFGESEPQNVTLTVLADPSNAPPIIDSSPSLSVEVAATYSYAIEAHDPESTPLSYQLLAGPSGMSLSGNHLSFVPQAGDVGEHSVLVRVTDADAAAAVQSYTLTVLGSPLRFVSTPGLVAAVGQQYAYDPEVVDLLGGPGELAFDLEGPKRGMQINTETGQMRWTPDAQQLGVHAVVIVATDEQGHQGRQFFSIEVLQASVVPTIVSEPVTSAIAGGQYHYDVNAEDLGEREVLSYYLLPGAPIGMSIDLVTGLISWQPDATGSYAVTVQVRDSSGQMDEQSFVIGVLPDEGAPEIEITADHETIAPGGSLVVSVEASDEVAVTSMTVTVDGAAVTLDENGQYSFSSTVPGVHTVVVTASDGAGNVATATLNVGVQDSADTQAPILELTSPSEDAELTYVHDIVGSATDANLMRYTLALRKIEEGAAFQEIGRGQSNVSAGVLGQLDTTLLENGYYELRLVATDVNGAQSEHLRPFRVDGQAKLGPVQLSFVDMAVPMAGIPIAVVRNYDSRVKTRQDFGVGWSLDVRQGSVQHNRKVGEGIAIYTQEGEFLFPCQGVFEQKSHFTQVRLSDRERYIFRPVVVNTQTTAGSCEGQVAFELVEGSTAGAELFVIGGLNETLVRAPALPIVQNPEVLPPSDLTYALDPERGVFNPSELRLELRDGRRFDVRLGRGITRVEDRHGNAISITSTGIHHSGGQSLFFLRDQQDRITDVIDAMGRRVQYGYDLNGDLARVTDPEQRITRFAYREQPPHHLDKIIGPDGRELAALDYDAGGRLSEVCDAEGACSESSYDLENSTLTQTDATEREVVYEYDGRGNVTSQTDALGHTVSFQYDADDNLVRAEGPDGSVATYTYDGSKNMLTRVLPYEVGEDPADFTYTYTYNTRNDRESVTLPSGGVIDFEYDGDGNLSAVKDGAGNVVQSVTYNADGTVATKTDRFGTVAFNAYNESGQPTQVTDSFGESITLLYDDTGRLLSRTERGVTMTMSYDGLGRPMVTDYGNGSSVSYEYEDAVDPRWTAIEGPTFGRVERSFTASGRLGSWREPNGDEFTRLYDASGRVEEEIDALGNRTTYEYDAAGRLETITDMALNATTTFERDSAGRVTKTIDALQNETVTAYKLGGRLQSTTNARGFTTSFDRSPVQSSITDALTRTTETSLTQLGLPTSTSYPGGSSTGSTYFGTTRLDESQSFPTSFEDELERTRSFGYDARSGLQSATDLAGGAWQYTYAPSQGAAVSYDVFSGKVSTAHHQGAAQAYRFGGGGTEYRDVSALGNDAAATGGGFMHHLQSVTSPLGETTHLIRGDNGRIERVVYPDGGEKVISYGQNALPETVTLPQGTVLSFDHDDALREVSRSSTLGEMREFTYGPNDRIETMTDNTGTTTYHYDTAGRFTGLTYPHGGSVRYDRDVLDRVTAVRVKPTATAAEIVTSYGYDENGNLETITDPLNGVTNFVYDQVDRLTTRTLPNGVTTSYGYDDRDRVLSVTHRGPMNNVLASVTYVRSASGEPTRITREDGSYVVLTYDAALRVDTETHYDAGNGLIDAIDYDYDDDGNRTAKTSLLGGYESYTYEPGFKLTDITTTAGVESYGYDGGGRLTSIDRVGVQRTLEYNSDDKLTRVLQGGSEVVEYTFDGVGRRVGMDDGVSARRYLVAPNLGDGFETPQAVTDGSGAVLTSYVFAGEHPVMRIENGQPVYYLQDAMGSVIGMADASGASTAAIKYDAFGNVTSSSGSGAAIPSSVGTDFRYHGMQLDAASGLYHVRARTYDARTGRLTSRDPFIGVTKRPETQHPYVFNSNNSFKWRDPSGRFGIGESMAAIGISNVLASIAMPSFSWALGRAPGPSDSDTPVYNLGGGQSGGDGLCVLKKAPTVREIGDATNQWLNGLAVGAGGGPGGNFIYEREADAFGHCWAACVLCRRCGEFATAFAGWGRELKREWWDGPDRDGREHDSFWQDINNQAVGRERAKNSGTCGEECAEAHSSGELDLTAPVTIRFWNIARKGWEIIRNRAPSLPY